ncbi:MAG TPA: hypothetical protein VGL59_11945 [Polyangia bacterium]|jgi:hypothetical protein
MVGSAWTLGCAAENGGSVTGSGGSTGNASGGSTGTNTGTGGNTNNGSGGQTTGTGSGGAVAGGSGGSQGSGGSSADAAVDKPASTDGSSGSEGGGVVGAACPSGVTTKFCEDFETQMAGQPPTGAFTFSGANGPTVPAGSILVDTTKPFDGTKSLHFNIPKPGPTAQLLFTKQFPMTDFNGRAMVYMSRVPTNGNHWDMLYSYFSATGGDTQWEVGGQAGVFELVCDPPDHGLDSKTKFPTGKWFCLQWRFKDAGAGMDNTYTVKVDGVAVDKGDFTGANSSGEKWPAGPWKNMSFGWTIYNEATSNVDIEFWVDDLAFGEQEIPCPNLPAMP